MVEFGADKAILIFSSLRSHICYHSPSLVPPPHPLPTCSQVAEPLLPYALAFAAGAMVFVVVDDIIPEGHSW